MRFTRYIPFGFCLAGLVLFVVAGTSSGCLIAVGSVFSDASLSVTCSFLINSLAFILSGIGLIGWVFAQILRKKSAKRIGSNN